MNETDKTAGPSAPDGPTTVAATRASMTGFGRAEGRDDRLAWAWELKSVNGKGLDIRLRLPSGFEALETPARQRCAAKLGRGNVTVGLSVERQAVTAGLRINRTFVQEVMQLSRELEAAGAGPQRLDALLGVRGIIETDEAGDDDGDGPPIDALIASLEGALDGLVASRRAEGQRLGDIVTGLVGEIEQQIGEAERRAGEQVVGIRDRLTRQIDELLPDGVPVNEDRLAQEIALYAAKADIREELDRLRAHIAQARELLADPAPVGRRLDFLCQEFNREANTLCSKSADPALTRTGMALKTAIDQLREQIQNVE